MEATDLPVRSEVRLFAILGSLGCFNCLYEYFSVLSHSNCSFY
jgi:hypothetical protein